MSIMVSQSLSTMVYKSLPWSKKVYHGLQKSTIVYKSLPWSTKVYHGPQRSIVTLGLKRETETMVVVVVVFEIQMQDAPIM